MLIPELLFHCKWQRNISDHFYGGRLGNYSSYILACLIVQARQIHCCWCFQTVLVLTLREFKEIFSSIVRTTPVKCVYIVLLTTLHAMLSN